MIHRLEREVPGKKFYSLGKICFTQKKITLDKVLTCLQKEKFEITIPNDTLARAQEAVQRMVEYS